MPKAGEKNVFVSGMFTLPPSASALKARSASGFVFFVTESENPLKLGLPEHMPSEAMTRPPSTVKEACMIFSAGAFIPGGGGSGLSRLRIIISTLAPSAFL